MNETKTISAKSMIKASNAGQPFNSTLWKRGIFNKFLLAKKIKVPISANKERTSIKFMINK